MKFISRTNTVQAEGPNSNENIVLTPKGTGIIIGAGGAAVGSGFSFIQQQTASASANINFLLPTGYSAYQVIIQGLVPVTDDTELYCRFSNNGGSTYRAGATDYGYAITTMGSGSGGGDLESTGAAQILLAHTTAGNGIGNAAGESASYMFQISNARVSSLFTRLTTISGGYTGGNGNFQRMDGGGNVRTAETNDAIRFLMSTGNITSGTFSLFGFPTIT